MTNSTIPVLPSERAFSIEDKVAFLKRAESYPYTVNSIEVIETHMSWVFLVDELVYKLKKPVNYYFLDLRTQEARLHNCVEEVRLNKRLAKHIYIGVVPIIVTKDGRLALYGKGCTTDWLVSMHRIPKENMLDYAITHNTITQSELLQPAGQLVDFYKNATPALTNAEQYKQRLQRDIETVYCGLSNPAFNFHLPLISKLSNCLLCYLHEYALLFDNRIRKGKIIEAHGDLRPEHVCICPEPSFIDCLEFSHELRTLDIADELAFLAMECELMGNVLVGKTFFETYATLTNDRIPSSLITFYKLKRAFNRAYIVARHITETSYKNDPKWIQKANAYLRLADGYHSMLTSEA